MGIYTDTGQYNVCVIPAGFRKYTGTVASTKGIVAAL